MFKKNLHQLIFVIYFISSITVFPQSNEVLSYSDITYTNKVWDAHSGLADDRVYDIIKDDEGFIWVATGLGVVRFDGSKFKIFNENNTKKLSNGITYEFHKDKNGSLYFINKFNIVKKDISNNFTLVELKTEENILPSCLEFDSVGTMWIGTLSNGLFSYNNNILKKEFIDYNFENSNISKIIIDKYGNFWICTGDRGVYVFRGGKLLNHLDDNYLPSKSVKNIFFDSSNNVWISTNNGVVKLLNFYSSKEISSKFITKQLISSIDEDSEGNILLPTSYYGLFIYKNDKLIDLNKFVNLSDKNLKCLLVDNDNIIIGTLKGGINFLRKVNIFSVSKKNGLDNEIVRSLYEKPDGSVLVGTNRGLYSLQSPIRLNKVKKLNVLSNNQIFAIRENKDGALLVGTKFKGLFIIKNNKVINFNRNNGLNSNFVRAIYIDDDSSYWVGTNSGGIAKIKGESISYLTEEEGLSNNFISFIYKSKKGEYWIGTSGGGVNVLGLDNKIKIYNTLNGLKENIISSIYEDDNGDIWLSLNGGGIALFRNNKFYNFTKDEGLYSNEILNIKKDKFGVFWCSTPSGIFSIKKSVIEKFISKKINKLSFREFDKSDGLISEKCLGTSPQTVEITREGILLFSTVSGLVEIDPRLIKDNKSNVKLYLDKIIVDNHKLQKEEYENIPSNSNRIDFYFGLINYINPHKIKLKSKLIGLDENWTDLNEENIISYTHIPYGKYTLALQGYNIGNKSKISSLNTEIYIRPFFWQTLIFKIIVYVLFILLMTILTRIILNRKYKRKLLLLEAERALDNERVRISRDMHDEFGSSLSKISLLTEIAKQKISDNKKIKDIINEISVSGRKLAESMDEIVWAVNPQNDRLDKLIYYLTNFFENHLSLTNIEFSYKIPDNIPDNFISAEFRHNLFCIIKEGINNTIKHSGADKIELIININEPKLQIKLKDNGKGINKDCISEFSNGISNMKNRANVIGGEIKIINLDTGGVEINIVVDFKMTQK